MFCKKSVPRNFAKFTRKQLCQSLFFNKVAALRKKETLAQVLSSEFFEISKNTSFTEHLRVTTSDSKKVIFLHEIERISFIMWRHFFFREENFQKNTSEEEPQSYFTMTACSKPPTLPKKKSIKHRYFSLFCKTPLNSSFMSCKVIKISSTVFDRMVNLKISKNSRKKRTRCIRFQKNLLKLNDFFEN